MRKEAGDRERRTSDNFRQIFVKLPGLLEQPISGHSCVNVTLTHGLHLLSSTFTVLYFAIMCLVDIAQVNNVTNTELITYSGFSRKSNESYLTFFESGGLTRLHSTYTNHLNVRRM